MIRTQISLEREDDEKPGCGAGHLTGGQSAWMKYAGFVETGDPDSSRSIDDLVYGTEG